VLLFVCVQAADFLSGMGLGMVADQLKELKLGELLETPPPGLDEAVAIAKVVQFVNSQVGYVDVVET
jgi:arsenite-transporting ATPase